MGAYNKCLDSWESKHYQLYSGEYILLDLRFSGQPIPSKDPRRQSIPSIDLKDHCWGIPRGMGAYNKCLDSWELKHNQLYSGEYILLDLSLSVLPIPSEDPRRQSIPSTDLKDYCWGIPRGMGAYNKCFDSWESKHNPLYSGEYILLDLSLSVLPIYL